VSRGLRIGFAELMLGLTLLFAGLGAWQLERLGEKDLLIAAVTEGLDGPPIPVPPPTEWPANASSTTADPISAAYRQLTATGSYIPGATVLVFTSLGAAKGQYSGPGYWVLTPLALSSGGTLFVNRGFVPQADGPAFASGGGVPLGEFTVAGIGKPAEPATPFTPAPNPADRIDWVRDPARLADFSEGLPQPVLPIYIDLPAGTAGELPQGGETVITFPNNHLGYAITWFGFALLTPVMLGFWLFGRRQTRRTE
jgi:surfeit locus 1 family protein